MATSESNGYMRVVDDGREPERRTVPRIPRAATPDDGVPRLVGLGFPADTAQQLALRHGEQQVTDALDALEELGGSGRIHDPARWVLEAVENQWDLTAVLADRRQRERRIAVLDADRQHREATDEAFPRWRQTADRWGRAISAALDDEQLGRAIEEVARPVPGIGRHSTPVTRAELVTWAIDVHRRRPDVDLAEALRDDLDAGPQQSDPAPWPLPAPPALPDDAAEPRPLASRISPILGRDRSPREVAEVIEVAVPHRTVRFGQDLER